MFLLKTRVCHNKRCQLLAVGIPEFKVLLHYLLVMLTWTNNFLFLISYLILNHRIVMIKGVNIIIPKPNRSSKSFGESEKNYIVSLVWFWRFCSFTCGVRLDISNFSFEDLQVSLIPDQLCCVNAWWREWGSLSASGYRDSIHSHAHDPSGSSPVTQITRFSAGAISRRAALGWFDVGGGKIYSIITVICVSRTKELPRVFVHLLVCCLPFSHT